MGRNRECQTEPKLLIREFRKGLELSYRDRLKGACLFGSYARGEKDAESDVDFLIVFDDIRHCNAEVERTSCLTSRLSLKYGVSISRVFVSDHDWRSRKAAFLYIAT